MKWFYCLPLVFLCGCAAVGPDYQRPEMTLSSKFTATEQKKSNTAQIDSAHIALNPWWQKYQDSRLNTLIERGLKQNLDVKAASERINEARAALRATGVNAALSGSLGADYDWSGGSSISTTHEGSGSLGADFVVDLFGGIRREREGALADLVYAQADVEVTQLAWLADFIADYANADYYRVAQSLTLETVKNRKETVAITKKQFAAGASTEYEVAEAEALLAAAEADLPEYTALFKSYVFAMATLLNEDAAPLLTIMRQEGGKIFLPAENINVGIPADLLRDRPDIRCAEADLISAVAAVGVAEADLYPSIALSGTLGLTEGASTWGFGPSLSLPIFNRGALSAERDAKVSLAKQAEISYRSAVMAAVEDVQVAQSNLEQYDLRAKALEKSSSAYEHALKLARQNYKSGAITLLDLLDTDRSAASAAISAASADSNLFQEWASLQIAVGAGAAVDKDISDEVK